MTAPGLLALNAAYGRLLLYGIEDSPHLQNFKG